MCSSIDHYSVHMHTYVTDLLPFSVYFRLHLIHMTGTQQWLLDWKTFQSQLSMHTNLFQFVHSFSCVQFCMQLMEREGHDWNMLESRFTTHLIFPLSQRLGTDSIQVHFKEYKQAHTCTIFIGLQPKNWGIQQICKHTHCENFCIQCMKQ